MINLTVLENKRIRRIKQIKQKKKRSKNEINQNTNKYKNKNTKKQIANGSLSTHPTFAPEHDNFNVVNEWVKLTFYIYICKKKINILNFGKICLILSFWPG